MTQIGLGVTDADKGLLKLEYAYNTTGNTDDNGAMLEQKITVPTIGATSGFTATQTYAYDALNRISSATETVSSTQTWKQEFSYDRYGNRNFVTGSGHTTTLGSCTTMCNPTFSSTTNRITSTGFSYDSSGNTTAVPSGQSFTYDGENKQVSVSNGSGTIAQYSYDGDGKRIKKYVPSTGETTVFVYDAIGKQIAEYSTIVEPQATAKVNYLTSDHLGSPRINTDQNGSVIARHDYHPFGEEIDGTGGRTSGLNYGSDTVRKQFTGYERDVETDLDYAQARYYNSQQGRFTSVDPLTASATIRNPQTFNRYSYALNSPYKFVDPLGLLSEYASGACGGRCANSDLYGFGAGTPIGRDSSFDWAFDWFGNILSYQVGSGPEQVNGRDFFIMGQSMVVHVTPRPVVRTFEHEAISQFLGGAEKRTLRFWRKPIYIIGTIEMGALAVLTGGQLISLGTSAEGLQTVGLANAGTSGTASSSGTAVAEVESVISRGLSNPETRGLTKDLLAHQRKLLDYIRNPLSQDSKDFLRNAPTEEIREAIFRGRVKGLVETIVDRYQRIQNILTTK